MLATLADLAAADPLRAFSIAFLLLLLICAVGCLPARRRY